MDKLKDSGTGSLYLFRSGGSRVRHKATLRLDVQMKRNQKGMSKRTRHRHSEPSKIDVTLVL